MFVCRERGCFNQVSPTDTYPHDRYIQCLGDEHFVSPRVIVSVLFVGLSPLLHTLRESKEKNTLTRLVTGSPLNNYYNCREQRMREIILNLLVNLVLDKDT